MATLSLVNRIGGIRFKQEVTDRLADDLELVSDRYWCWHLEESDHLTTLAFFVTIMTSKLSPMIKIGAVSYLNTKPLVYGLADRTDEVELSFDLPSRLADQLANGELDVALIPSVETFLQDELTIVSDACIACHGPVWSVKLFSRVPFENIQTLALDEGSRTSAALSQILLRKLNCEPEIRLLGIDVDWKQTECDAVLVIGDRAMKPHDEIFSHRKDLGEWWADSTGLPFVFAVWAARPGIDCSRLDDILTESRELGLQHVDQIAMESSQVYGLTVDQCSKYLTQNLHYYLGPSEKSGLDLFYDKASLNGLVPSKRELIFYG